MTTVTAAASSDRYDLRTLGKLSPIRNQGQDGNCWAFASIASLESSLLPGEKYDFSENNEKNLHGFGVPINLGGNDFMATAYLARWSGPVSEAADPYSYGNTVSPSGVPVEKHVQEVFFIPTRREPLDNDLIKSAVRQYGAVYSTLRYEASSYSQRTASYYYSGSGAFNHAIDIVGWDDGYSSANFDNPPPGNGGFFARRIWNHLPGEPVPCARAALRHPSGPCPPGRRPPSVPRRLGKPGRPPWSSTLERPRSRRPHELPGGPGQVPAGRRMAPAGRAGAICIRECESATAA